MPVLAWLLFVALGATRPHDMHTKPMTGVFTPHFDAPESEFKSVLKAPQRIPAQTVQGDTDTPSVWK